MTEIWKDIEGFEGRYQISNLGRVKSLSRYVQFGKQRRFVPEYIRKEKSKPNGYRYVQLNLNGKEKDFHVHRLVAKHFVPGYFDGAHVNHKDGNKANNTADNLEWCTRSENQRHMYHVLNHKAWVNGRFGAESPRAKRIVQLSMNGEVIREWSCAADVQRELGIQESGIRKVLKGTCNQAGGFKWKYA